MKIISLLSFSLMFFIFAQPTIAQLELEDEIEIITDIDAPIEDTNNSLQDTAVDLASLNSSLLIDMNGDGVIQIDAFGDSITRGVGDFFPIGTFIEESTTPVSEAGYPLRLEQVLNLPVSNLGLPGERVVLDGLFRFASLFQGRGTDIVLLSGGTNDAIDQIFTNNFQTALQTMINIARAEGALPILVTPPPTCCDNSNLSQLVNGFNETTELVATINDLPLANIRRAFENTCGNFSGSCFLISTPEGIHPNITGYDVMTETILATLFNIDLFAPDGPAALDQVLGRPENSTITLPDPSPASTVPVITAP